MSEQDEQVVDTTSSTDDGQDIEINLDDNENVEANEKTYSEHEFKQVLARAKKAEAENRNLKGSTSPSPTQTLQTNGLSEEAVQVMLLKSQGMSEDLIEEAKALAKVRNKQILDIQSDPIFIAIKEAKEAKDKAERSKLGASRGSSTVRKEKSLQTPGLSDAERKELWKAEQAR